MQCSLGAWGNSEIDRQPSCLSPNFRLAVLTDPASHLAQTRVEMAASTPRDSQEKQIPISRRQERWEGVLAQAWLGTKCVPGRWVGILEPLISVGKVVMGAE